MPIVADFEMVQININSCKLGVCSQNSSTFVSRQTLHSKSKRIFPLSFVQEECLHSTKNRRENLQTQDNAQ